MILTPSSLILCMHVGGEESHARDRHGVENKRG